MSGAATRLRAQAVEAARLGQVAQAKALHQRALSEAPDDPSIINSAALFFSKNGETERAVQLLHRAVALDPCSAEPRLNLALILTSAGQPEAALALLGGQENRLGQTARYWSIRAGAERALGARRDALASFARAASLDPGNSRARHGVARMSLETGLAAAEHYRAVIAAQPGERDAWLGLAQALDAENRVAEATALLETMVEQAPEWIEALELLAQLRWASGDREQFARHYAAAVECAGNWQVYASWCRTLASVDQHLEAAEVAVAAQRKLGRSAEFALVEASQLGMAGANEAAERIFAALDAAVPGRLLHEARHRLRTGDPAAAERLATQMIAADGGDVAAWALRDLAWRLLGDLRHEWLHGQEGLIASVGLGLEEQELSALINYLDRLHDASTAPAGQSVRDGTQTRGGLFDRHEAEARRIEQAFLDATGAYRAGLPPPDPEHPLLRHRDAQWRIAGSWSVRLLDAGRHVPHIHPRGLVSSAAYFAVPPATCGTGDEQAGWLELGRPPVDLRLDLPPLATIEPRVGMCIMFPSTLYHGTREFSAGKRMSAAIDINLARAA